MAGEGALGAAHARVPTDAAVRASVLTGARSEDLDETDPRGEVLRAYAPYALIVVSFSLAQTPAVKDWPEGDPDVPLALPQPRVSRGGSGQRQPLEIRDPDGVAVSGSDTSANALFGALQVTAARESRSGAAGRRQQLGRSARHDDLAPEPHLRLRRPSGSEAARGPAAQGAAPTLSTPSDLR